MTEKAEASAGHADDGSRRPLVVIDFGKRQSRKKIRKLRKGKGPLIKSIDEFLDELIESKKIEAAAQPVVIIVREKRKRGCWPFGG